MDKHDEKAREIQHQLFRAGVPWDDMFIAKAQEILSTALRAAAAEGKWAGAHRDVDFPFTAVKSELLHQVVAAMEMKAFDQLGIVMQPASVRGDPIVVGQLLPAVDAGLGSKPPTTFFIGWWLNTADL